MTDQPTPTSETQSFVPVSPEPEPGPGTLGPAPATPLARSGRPSTGRWVNVVLAAAIAVAIGGVGFAAGRMTAPASVLGGNGRTFSGGTGQFPGSGQLPGGGYVGGGDIRDGQGGGGLFRGIFGGGASIQGTVEAISGDTLTLKLADGQTIQLSLSGSTTYHAQAPATSSDVKTGSQVVVRLQLDRGQDGGPTSPSASDVTIVP